MNKNPEYFKMIVQEGSITKAAEKMFVSQPYLSQYITKLEKELDIKLLNRNKTPLELTEAGKIYYAYLRNSQQLNKKLILELDSLNYQRSITLNLGFSPWRGSTLLPDILPIFSKRYPKVQLQLNEHPSNELQNLLKNNKIDLAIVNSSLDVDNDINKEIICYEKIKLVSNKNNEKTQLIKEAVAQKKENPLEIIENERFVLLKKGLLISDAVHDYFDNMKIVPKNTIYTTNNTTALNLVSVNMGFGFIVVSSGFINNISENLEFIDLNSEDLTVPLVALYRKDDFLSAAARDFIDITKEHYNLS